MTNFKPLVIGIDVDQTVNGISSDWLSYLLKSYPLKKNCAYPVLTKRDELPYNLTEMFEVGETITNNGFEFWHQANLYDNMDVRVDAVRVVPLLKELGHTVVFVSTVIGHHSLSKTNYINRHFPCNDGIVFTHQKHLVKLDVLIDDCYSNLNSLGEDVRGIKFRMDFKEKCKPVKDFKIVYNWDEVYTLLKDTK